ncbi:MAG: response regulator transcription factor [Chloroflexota bacterium]|jgi:DNA-binding NarL/FixJ family response regulator
MDDTIRVLIVDDHQLFRDGLRVLILSAADMEVAGEASTGKAAVQMAAESKPDVVLMDIQMPDMDGIEATKVLIERDPELNILMVTMFEDDQSVFAAMRAGARGYILKGAKHDEMLRAIRAVGSGEAIFSPGIASRMMAFFTTSRVAIPAEAFPDLTEREREVLELIAQGKSNAEIARALVISVKTVRNHASNIFNKLQVTDRAQAAIRAREAGLGE